MNPDRHTLLVVDDDADLREILAISLARKGFDIVEACNGIQALEIVKKQKLSLIMSDVNMPGGNGVKLLESVKEIDAEIPVILFVTASTGITIDAAYDKGAEALFSKPYDFKALHQTVLKIIEARFASSGAPRVVRHDLNLSIDFTCEDSNVWRQGQISNLGRGGFFMKIERDFLKTGQTIQFRLHLMTSSNEMLEGAGLVRWNRSHADPVLPAGCGIEFLNIGGEGLTKLRELVNFAQTRQFIPKA